MVIETLKQGYRSDLILENLQLKGQEQKLGPRQLSVMGPGIE